MSSIFHWIIVLAVSLPSFGRASEGLCDGQDIPQNARQLCKLVEEGDTFERESKLRMALARYKSAIELLDELELESASKRLIKEKLQSSLKQIYEEIRGWYDRDRHNFAAEYSKSTEKKKVIQRTRDFLEVALLDDFFPLWIGTKWDFYGISETPGCGPIACGYFVTTLFRDLGFNINRISLAQAASETMIKAIVPGEKIQRFRNIEVEEFVGAVAQMPPGIYVVGLDNHTGFLSNYDGQVDFIHSSPSGQKVMVEKARKSPWIVQSKYRVVGRAFTDSTVIKWLQDSRIDLR